MLLAILTPFALTQPQRFAEEVVKVAAEQRKPLFACWMGGEGMLPSRQLFAEYKVPSYATPEAAVDAIFALTLFKTSQEQLLQVPTPLGPSSTPDLATAQAILDAALAARQEWLNPRGFESDPRRVRHPGRHEPACLFGRGGRADRGADRLSRSR